MDRVSGVTLPRVREVIVVEGRYDKNTLSQIVDATIVETSGFGIFSDGDKRKLLRRMAEARGLIVLTDSDGAGFVIRNYIKGCVPPEYVKHAYIPDIEGRERRKTAPSKEGKLGVEGMKPQVLLDALRAAGATFEGGGASRASAGITKADMYALGLLGGVGSAEKRRELLRRMDLPEKLSSSAMLDVLNTLTDLEGLKKLADGS